MKTMKKSMFLTTVLMVVLLVVALSTATFAWYTANTNVGATATTLNSAKSTAASLAIDYASTLTTSSNSTIDLTLDSGSTGLMPMIPSASPTAETTLTGFTFTTAPINNENLFTKNGEATSPAQIQSITVNSTAHTQTNFYVINTNVANSADVKVKVTIDTANAYRLTKAQPANWVGHESDYFTRSGDTFSPVTTTPAWAANTYYELYTGIASDMRVAIFACAPSGTPTYIGTWGSTAATYYGAISQGNGKIASPLSTYNATSSGTQVVLGNIAALGAKEIYVVAWFDGPSLEVDEAQSAATFTVSFDTYTPAP